MLSLFDVMALPQLVDLYVIKIVLTFFDAIIDFNHGEFKFSLLVAKNYVPGVLIFTARAPLLRRNIVDIASKFGSDPWHCAAKPCACPRAAGEQQGKCAQEQQPHAAS
jgi:hypothetical protein